MNGHWKWVATTAVGLILMLLGGVIQRMWSDRELTARMEGVENQIIQLTVTMSGDHGYGNRIADFENRIRQLEKVCPRGAEL